MSYHTAEALLNSAKELGINFNADGRDLTSAVMVNARDGYQPSDLGKEITNRLKQEGIQADVVIPQNIMSSTTKNIGDFILNVHLFSITLWILICVLLTVIFTFSIHERKNEQAIFRIIGATRKKLLNLIFCESLIVCCSGSLIGILTGYFFVFPFSTYISMRLNLPYLLPQLNQIVFITVFSFLLSSVIGPIASAYGAYRIGRNGIQTTFREGE